MPWSDMNISGLGKKFSTSSSRSHLYAERGPDHDIGWKSERTCAIFREEEITPQVWCYFYRYRSEDLGQRFPNGKPIHFRGSEVRNWFCIRLVNELTDIHPPLVPSLWIFMTQTQNMGFPTNSFPEKINYYSVLANVKRLSKAEDRKSCDENGEMLTFGELRAPTGQN